MNWRFMILTLLLATTLINSASLKAEADSPICGIGIVAVGDTPSRDTSGAWGETIILDHLVINELIPGGPAIKNGLQKGDAIIQVDDRKVAGMMFKDAFKLIRGPVGTSVKITIRQTGQIEPILFTITRELVHLPK